MPQQKKKSIGVFDSGFGGLTILHGLVKELPEYDYLYLGDSARAPYGSRSQEVIYMFTKQAVDFLFAQNCELIILACNTASSEALRRIQQEHLPQFHPEKKVLGVIIPAAEAATGKGAKKVGVIATESTVASQAFVREIKKLDPSAAVFQNACPLLVPIIEAGEHRSDITDTLLRKYLAPLLKKNIDTLILGCTHYEILRRKIQTIVGKNVTVISESTVVAKKLRNYLARHPEIEQQLGKKGQRQFYSTDRTEKFTRLGSQFFGASITVRQTHTN